MHPIGASLSSEDLPWHRMPELLDFGNLGSFAFSMEGGKPSFSMEGGKQAFDDDEPGMLVYTRQGMDPDGEEASRGHGPPLPSFHGWTGTILPEAATSTEEHKASHSTAHAQAILQPPAAAAAAPPFGSFFRESDNQSLARSSVPSILEPNSSGGRLSQQQVSTSQLPTLNPTYSADHESFPFDREGSADDGSLGSASKKRVRIPSEVRMNNKRSPTTRGPFHPSGPCLMTDMTEEYRALERVLTMASAPQDIAEEAADQVYVPKRGKGGRNPALDARLDPSIDPKKAARIMANRLSAAKSKMRRKMLSTSEGVQSKLVLLESQKHRLEREVERLDKLCRAMEVEVYGEGSKKGSGTREGAKGVLKASAGIAFEIDFANPMDAVAMEGLNFALPTVDPSNGHPMQPSWSHINPTGFNMESFNYDHGASWQAQAAALLEQRPAPHHQGFMGPAAGSYHDHVGI